MSKPAEFVIRPKSTGIIAMLLDLWRYKRLVVYFSARTVRMRYKETILGWLWLIIRPLIPALISTVIFGKLAQFPSDDVPYLVFFFTGMSLWTLFNTALLYATRSMRLNRRLVTKLYFPRIIIPLTSIAPFVLEFFINIAVLIGIFILFYVRTGVCYVSFRPALLLCGIFFLATLILAWGIGFVTSILNAQARDVRFTLPFVLNMWYFITPVIYPLSFIPEKWRPLAILNPMTAIVEGFKWSILGRGELNIWYVVYSLVLVLLVFAGGLYFFSRAEAKFIDSM
ncbi:MAG: ABC transporter permease [Candidatus Auribacterota bacterium]